MLFRSFTHRGAVQLAVRCAGGTTARPVIAFAVIDSGWGIPRDVRERLARPVSSAETTQEPGLAVCRAIAVHLNGKLETISVEGVGSTVTLSVPLAIASPSGNAEAAEPGPALRVLVAEDNAVNQRLIRLMLENFGCATTVVGNGREAIAALLAAPGGHDLILLDMHMPEIDGLMLVKFFRVNPTTRDTPMIVLSSKEEATIKAESFARGANDYLVKWPEAVELVARIRYPSNGYIHLLERNEAYAALETSQKALAAEIAAGSAYVQSLLPAPMTDPLAIDWRYVPCADLAGDSLGFHTLDDEHVAIYLLDVTGHGLASALLGVTVMNVLRAKSLPNTDFRKPGEVLGALNEAFPMENQNNNCFSIWYAMLHLPTRTLRWRSEEHTSEVQSLAYLV